MSYELDTLHPAVTAADYLISALGRGGALIAMRSMRAGALTPDEARKVEPLAVAIAYLLEMEVPTHRKRKASGLVVRANVAAHVARALR